MKKKLLDVLSYLYRQNSWTTASEIAIAAGCSIRSVKTYIAELNISHPDFIASSKKGFLLSDREMASDLLKNEDEQIPQTAEGRKSFIMQRLLIENRRMNLDVLAAELCISPLTLNNEIAKFKKELIPFDLVSHTKNNEIWIEGNEKNKKKMISHMIYENTRDFCCNMDAIQSYLPDFDLRIIRQITTESIRQNHYFIDDFSVLNFVLHIGITMERHLGQNSSRMPIHEDGAVPLDAPSIPSHIAAVMNQISNKIERYFQIQFTNAENCDLALLLMTRIVREDIGEGTETLKDLVPKDILNLLEVIQHRVRQTFHLNLNSQDFLLRFALHLKNMMVRLQQQIGLKNPQLNSIKNTYPFIYDVSVFIADIIRQETGFLLSEDEIAYIALHIGVLIEEQRALRDKVKVLIVSPQYYSSDQNLVKKISLIFEDNIILNGVLSGPEEIPAYRNYDLIISTMPIVPAPNVPVILVPYHLRNSDIAAVSTAIETIKKSRMKTLLEQKLKYLFHKELFFHDPGFRSKQDIISSMADSLEKLGFVASDYKQRLFERENISSSAYGSIALPHPLEMHARKTAIAVAVYPSSVPWNENRVNLVLMLAITEDDRPLFRDIFDFVTEIISDAKNLQSLTAAKTYDDFIHLLVSLS